MSKKKNKIRRAGPVRVTTDFERAMQATRSLYSNAVAWGTNLLTSARDEYSLDDATCARLYAISVTAWTCANFRALQESMIAPRLLDANGQPVPADQNPINWLMKHSITTLFKLSMSTLIWGKFYLRKHYNTHGLPTRLEYLSPLDVSPIVDYDKQDWEGFRVRGEDRMVPPGEMIVGLQFDPLNDFDGVSPYEVSIRQTIGDRELVRFAQKFFQEGTMLGGMLDYEGNLSDEEYNKVQAEFKQFKGSQNAFKTFVAGGGLTKFKYTPMQPNPVDLAMAELKDLLRSDTCAAFNVHPALIGIGNATDPLSAQSTYEQIQTYFMLNVAVPRVSWILEVLTTQWLTPDFAAWGVLKLEPDTSEITSASKAVPERSTTAVGNAGRIWTINEARDYTGRPLLPNVIQMNPDWPLALWQQGVISRNEARAAVGLNAVTEDGFIYELDPRAKQVAPALSIGFPQSRAAPLALPTGEIRALTPEEDALQKAQLAELENWRKKVDHRGRDVAFTPAHLPGALCDHIRTELAGLWNPRAVFSEARAAIKERRDPQPTGASPEAAQRYWQHYDALKTDLGADWLDYQTQISPALWRTLDEGHPETLLAVFDQQTTAQGQFAEALTGTLERPGPLLALVLAGMQAGDKALEQERPANPEKPLRQFDIGVNFTLMSAQARRFVYNYSFALVKETDDYTRQTIMRIMEEHITKGTTMADLRAKLEKVIVPLSTRPTETIKQRAARIGQTESVRAYNSGAYQRWQDAGVTEVEWQTARDSHVCANCRALHGVRAPMATGWTAPDGTVYKETCHVGGRCFRKPIVPARTSEDIAKLLQEVETLAVVPSIQQLPIAQIIAQHSASYDPVLPQIEQYAQPMTKRLDEIAARDSEIGGQIKTETWFASAALKDMLASEQKLKEATTEEERRSAEFYRRAHEANYQRHNQQFKTLMDERRQLTIEATNLRTQRSRGYANVIRGNAPASTLNYRIKSPAIQNDPEREQRVRDSMTWINQSMNGAKHNPTLQQPFDVLATTSNRAFFKAGEININRSDPQSTIIHETGHAIEATNPEIHRRCVEFLKYRAAGKKPVSLNALTKRLYGRSAGYDKWEEAYDAGFPDPYCGKQYANDHATELLSMGLQYLYNDPLKFAKEDREYFDFIMSIVRGDIL